MPNREPTMGRTIRRRASRGIVFAWALWGAMAVAAADESARPVLRFGAPRIVPVSTNAVAAGKPWRKGTGGASAQDGPVSVLSLPASAAGLSLRHVCFTENGGDAWRRYWLPTNFEIPCVGWNGRAAVIGTSGGNDHPDGDKAVATKGA